MTRGAPLFYSQQQLNEHVELARRAVRAEAVGALESYAEACKRQALALGLAEESEHLRGAIDACMLMAEVVRSRG